MISYQYEKVTQALNYLIRKSPNNSLDKVHLIKMTWAADRYHLRKYGRLVTEDNYFAMSKGPVASLALDIINESTDYLLPEEYLPYTTSYLKRQEHSVQSKRETEREYLSDSDVEALDFAWDQFGESGDDLEGLVTMTHRYPEWTRFEQILKAEKTSVPMVPTDFFDDPSDMQDDPFSMNDEVKDNSKKYFEEISEAKSILYL